MVAQSITKEKVIVANATITQAIWIRKILVNMYMKQIEPTKIFVDNQAVIAISKDPVFHRKTKHFNIKLYHLREKQKAGEIKLIYCETKEQIANLLTKALQKVRFEDLKNKLTICKY